MDQTEWEASVIWVGVVAACAIKQDNKYLLIQEKQARAYGLWNFPAGHVDKGESIETAAVREAHEETGYQVKLIKQVGVYHEETSRPVKHVFQAEITGGKLEKPEDEILDVKWLTYEEIKALQADGKLRAPFIWEAIQQLEKSEPAA